MINYINVINFCWCYYFITHINNCNSNTILTEDSFDMNQFYHCPTKAHVYNVYFFILDIKDIFPSAESLMLCVDDNEFLTSSFIFLYVL